jgi:hypothetical protein
MRCPICFAKDAIRSYNNGETHLGPYTYICSHCNYIVDDDWYGAPDYWRARLTYWFPWIARFVEYKKRRTIMPLNIDTPDDDDIPF